MSSEYIMPPIPHIPPNETGGRREMEVKCEVHPASKLFPKHQQKDTNYFDANFRPPKKLGLVFTLAYVLFMC